MVSALARRTQALTVKTSAPNQVRAPFPGHLSTPSATCARGPRLPSLQIMALSRGQFMNNIRNPQAAAAEARANYREVTSKLGALGFDTAIPEGVRALAESTVDQTREAYDRSTDAFEASVATFEKSFDAAGRGAAAFNRK